MEIFILKQILKTDNSSANNAIFLWSLKTILQQWTFIDRILLLCYPYNNVMYERNMVGILTPICEKVVVWKD